MTVDDLIVLLHGFDGTSKIKIGFDPTLSYNIDAIELRLGKELILVILTREIET